MADFTKCTLHTLLLLFVFFFDPCTCLAKNVDSRKENVKYLYPGMVITVQHPSNLDLFCFLGRTKTLVRAWETAILQVQMDADNFDHYIGASLDDVISAFDLHHYSWSIMSFASKSNTIHINPFNQSCIGIHSRTNVSYKIRLKIIRVDFWRVLMVVSGVLLFFAAPKLCKNPLFYYICGVTAGICLSFMILIYFFSKLLPKKPMMYGVLVGGWTVSVYLVQILWDNFRTVFEQYGTHVLAYITSVGLLSFAFCYRFGPVTDPRSRNLIKWSLQCAAMVLILFSSWFQEASVSICLILLSVYLFPASWISKLRSFWKRRFPPRVKLLSEDQYHEQGVRETQKALKDLRGYCSSPECDAWRTVLKIKNPVRFAEFMAGNSHITDTEILAYESESRPTGPLDESESEESVMEDEYY